jgi:drug/metabolite transporter, DME family
VVAGNAIAFLACLPGALPVTGATPGDVLAIGYLGVFQIGAAYLLLTSGIRHVTALEASMLLLLEPALNPLWSWLAHGESPGAWSIAGGALILGATTLRTLWEAGAERRLAAPRRTAGSG